MTNVASVADYVSWLGTLLINVGIYGHWFFKVDRLKADIMVFTGCVIMGICNFVLTLDYMLTNNNDGFITTGFTALFTLVAWDYWKRIRRQRKWLKQLIGAKSKAIRDKLVKKARELKPRPILRPVPQPG